MKGASNNGSVRTRGEGSYYNRSNIASFGKTNIIVIILAGLISRGAVRSVAAFSSTVPVGIPGSARSLSRSRSPFLSRRGFVTTSSSISRVLMSTSEMAEDAIVVAAPPVARREESRVVLAGVNGDVDGKEGKQNVKPLVRQSERSDGVLLDPPVPVSDPYGWMRDESRTDPELLQHLANENAFTSHVTQHLEPLRKDLYDHMLQSIQETDYSVPTKDGDFLYYSRTFEGKSYTVYCRAPIISPTDANADEKVADLHVDWDGSAETHILPNEEAYLDVNQLAEGQKYCSVGRVAVSPSQKLLAYTVDFVGGETCQLFVKNLETGEIVSHDPDLELYGVVLWGPNDETLYYITMDDAHRPYRVYKHVLGTKHSQDELIFQEEDELFWMYASKTLDKRYLLISTKSKETAEVHYLDLFSDDTTLQCVAKRRKKVLYSVKHHEGSWFISTNVGGTPNMKLVSCPVGPNCEDQWMDVVDETTGKTLFDGGYDRALSGITCFKQYAVACGREGGIPRVWVMKYENNGSSSKVCNFDQLTFDETAYDVGLGSHYEYDTTDLVIGYDSLITPLSTLKIDMSHDPINKGERVVLKSKAVPGYNKDEYSCDRITVKSRDGTTEIPVSLVYRTDVMEQHLQDGIPIPTHLYGYGSYGACMEASFRATRLPLLDHGMVYIIAHVRGGGEMGRQWYEEPMGAKYLCKKNTFNDFVDVARWLVDEKKMTTSTLLSCEGRSAGGLLIGASINQAPELFKVALLGVPFVDVVPTMIDASIPLTIVEWEEWGNPNEEKYHQYMMEYSPINNVQKGATYPSCLLTGGLHDPRVQYWEPAKFAAELRHNHVPESSGPVCLKIDMAAGHFSASDRYKYYKELAFDYAFILDQLGLHTPNDTSK